MIHTYWWRIRDFLWRYEFVRFMTVQGSVGFVNYFLAFGLFWYLAVDKYLATIAGYMLHVCLAFYLDRQVTFQVESSKWWRMFFIYCSNGLVTFMVILGSLYLLTDYFAVPALLAQYAQLSEKEAVVAIRIGPVMLVGLIVSFTLNKLLAFKPNPKQPGLN